MIHGSWNAQKRKTSVIVRTGILETRVFPTGGDPFSAQQGKDRDPTTAREPRGLLIYLPASHHILCPVQVLPHNYCQRQLLNNL